MRNIIVSATFVLVLCNEMDELAKLVNLNKELQQYVQPAVMEDTAEHIELGLK